MLTRTESLPWHSPPTAVASYLGRKKVFGQFGGIWNLAPRGWEPWDVFFLCETQIFAAGNWMVGTLIVSFLGAVFRPSL